MAEIVQRNGPRFGTGPGCGGLQFSGLEEIPDFPLSFQSHDKKRQLRYSFDIKRKGIVYEVGVYAKTGKVLENSTEGSHPD